MPRSVKSTCRWRRPAVSREPLGGSRCAVLFPLSRPGLLVAFLLVFIPSFSELSATILLYAGGTETIAIAIYRLNDLGQLEVVSALSVFMIAVVLALTGLINWLSRSRSTSEKMPAQV